MLVVDVVVRLPRADVNQRHASGTELVGRIVDHEIERVTSDRVLVVELTARP